MLANFSSFWQVSFNASFLIFFLINNANNKHIKSAIKLHKVNNKLLINLKISNCWEINLKYPHIAKALAVKLEAPLELWCKVLTLALTFQPKYSVTSEKWDWILKPAVLEYQNIWSSAYLFVGVLCMNKSNKLQKHNIYKWETSRYIHCFK